VGVKGPEVDRGGFEAVAPRRPRRTADGIPHLLAGEGTQDSLRQHPPRRSVGMGFLGGQAAAINMPQRGYLRAGSLGLAP
jgi:hypothetical protein